MRRGSRSILALGMALSAVFGVSNTAVQADNPITTPANPSGQPTHFGRFINAAGVPDPTGRMAFDLYDYSNDSGVHQAWYEVLYEWNSSPEVNDGYYLPRVHHVVMPPGHLWQYERPTSGSGDCEITQMASQWSVVCFEVNLTNPADLGLTHYNPNVAHSFDWNPVIVIGPQTRGWEAMKTLLRHELGHALGLPHTSDCNALMADTDICGPYVPGRSWTDHDMTHLRNWYRYGGHNPDHGVIF